MEISKQQLKTILQNKPAGVQDKQLLEGLIDRGYNIEGLDPLTTSAYRGEKQLAGQISGNQFEQKPQSFWGKARDFAATIIGGKELAKGLGKSLAAPQVQSTIDDTMTSLYNTQWSLIQRIKEKQLNGEDTTRLEAALKTQEQEIKRMEDVSKDFIEDLPSNKQVIGSAARLAGTVAGGAIAGGTKAGTSRFATSGIGKAVGANKALPGLSQAFGVGQATTIGGGALRGAGAGAAAGAIEGGIQGAGIAAEQDGDTGDIIRGGVLGAGTGAAVGGLIGTIAGGFRGYKNPDTLQQKTQYITPDAGELTPTQYEEFIRKGKIRPRTTTQPAQYVWGKDEAQTISKYSDAITKDPTQTAINMMDKVDDLDKQVGTFLQNNNGIFNKGELRNSISQQMDDIIDITVPEEQLVRAKTKLVDAFVDGLDKNDMYSLWKARKSFDQQIQNAFSGSPSLQKEVKKALRNSVQDFIKARTPNTTYSDFMNDMSSLININDLVVQKAAKQRTASELVQWIKTNPKKAKAAGWTAALIGGGLIARPVLGSVGVGQSE